MVATGFPYGKSQNIEIIDLTNPNYKCNYLVNTVPKEIVTVQYDLDYALSNETHKKPDESDVATNERRQWAMAQYFSKLSIDATQRSDALGGMIHNVPVICGGKFYGDFYKDCFVVGQSKLKVQMLEERRWPASIVYNQYSLWIVGGMESKTSEFISLKFPPMRGPEFPFTIFGHSMIIHYNNLVYMIGGIVNGSLSGRTWIVDPMKHFQMVEGPHLNYERCRHSCGLMKIGERHYIVVAGGTGHDNAGATVELLDPVKKKWIIGKTIILSGFSRILQIPLGSSRFLKDPTGFSRILQDPPQSFSILQVPPISKYTHIVSP